MRIILFFCFTMLYPLGYAKDKNICLLDDVLKNTTEYKNYLLSDEENTIELEKNELSLLPDIFINSSQNSNNDRSFRSVENSGLSIGFSQGIYSGGAYKKNKNRINLNKNLNNLLLSETKNKMLLDVFSDALELEHRIDKKNLYKKQLERQTYDIRRIEAGINSGSVAKIDLDIANIRIRRLKDQINALGFEIDNLSEKVYFKYRIPKTEIMRVNYSSVRNCKTGNYKDNLKNKFNLRSDIARASNEILEATSLPSVNFAISFTPPETGNINNITTKRADFGASINVSIPVSQYFLRNTYQKQFAIDVARLKLEYDNSLEENENETRSIERKIKSLENSIETTKKSIAVERNKINYIFSRIKEGQDNIISYYQQLDTYEALQINLKEEEKELEFQKVLLYFIS